MSTKPVPNRQGCVMHSPFTDSSRWISENRTAAALLDAFPVSKGHTLVVPKRIVSSVFHLEEDEILDMWRLIKDERERLERAFGPTGFNIGINDGTQAGQTVFHAHIHLIPRYPGDHPSPRGGIRAIIIGAKDYDSSQ